MALSSQQRRRIRRTQESSRRLRELERETQRRSIPGYARQHPDYWRDLSVEIAGPVMAAAMLFFFGRFLGYIEEPDIREELLRLIGLIVVVSAFAFAFVRVRRVSLDRASVPPGQRVRVYLHAISPHWTIPALLLGVVMSLGYL